MEVRVQGDVFEKECACISLYWCLHRSCERWTEPFATEMRHERPRHQGILGHTLCLGGLPHVVQFMCDVIMMVK